jgi:Xanthine and CO dehydrogenases maturation factor, XdhC/CoxF family
MRLDHLTALHEAAAARRPVAYATRLTDGAAYILPDLAAPNSPPDSAPDSPPDSPRGLLATEAAAMLAAGRTGVVTIADEPWFIESRTPSPRAFIIGAVHIAQTLAPLAVSMGFDVVVIDPRRTFAAPDRFPGIALRTDWPDEALDALNPDSATAIITLTHDPKLDDPGLIRALASDAFYIGALGSRKTHAARLERLTASGISTAAQARICAPVGLDIGAVTAPEIALSIIGQIVAARRGKLAKS